MVVIQQPIQNFEQVLRAAISRGEGKTKTKRLVSAQRITSSVRGGTALVGGMMRSVTVEDPGRTWWQAYVGVVANGGVMMAPWLLHTSGDLQLKIRPTHPLDGDHLGGEATNKLHVLRCKRQNTVSYLPDPKEGTNVRTP